MNDKELDEMCGVVFRWRQRKCLHLRTGLSNLVLEKVPVLMASRIQYRNDGGKNGHRLPSNQMSQCAIMMIGSNNIQY